MGCVECNTSSVQKAEIIVVDFVSEKYKAFNEAYLTTDEQKVLIEIDVDILFSKDSPDGTRKFTTRKNDIKKRSETEKIERNKEISLIATEKLLNREKDKLIVLDQDKFIKKILRQEVTHPEQ